MRSMKILYLKILQIGGKETFLTFLRLRLNFFQFLITKNIGNLYNNAHTLYFKLKLYKIYIRSDSFSNALVEPFSASSSQQSSSSSSLSKEINW